MVCRYRQSKEKIVVIVKMDLCYEIIVFLFIHSHLLHFNIFPFLQCLRTLVGHTGGVWSSQMSGTTVISGSTDRTLKVWNAETGQCIHTLYGHTSTVRCMHLHGNKVVSGSRDATLRVWQVDTGECLHVLVGHLAAVRCVQYDGKLVVSGAYDYMVKVWNPEREECLHTLQGHTNRVYSLQVRVNQICTQICTYNGIYMCPSLHILTYTRT